MATSAGSPIVTRTPADPSRRCGAPRPRGTRSTRNQALVHGGTPERLGVPGRRPERLLPGLGCHRAERHPTRCSRRNAPRLCRSPLTTGTQAGTRTTCSEATSATGEGQARDQPGHRYPAGSPPPDPAKQGRRSTRCSTPRLRHRSAAAFDEPGVLVGMHTSARCTPAIPRNASMAVFTAGAGHAAAVRNQRYLGAETAHLTQRHHPLRSRWILGRNVEDHGGLEANA